MVCDGDYKAFPPVTLRCKAATVEPALNRCRISLPPIIQHQIDAVHALKQYIVIQAHSDLISHEVFVNQLAYTNSNVLPGRRSENVFSECLGFRGDKYTPL